MKDFFWSLVGRINQVLRSEGMVLQKAYTARGRVWVIHDNRRTVCDRDVEVVALAEDMGLLTEEESLHLLAIEVIES